MPLPLSLLPLAVTFLIGIASMATGQSPGPLNGQMYGAGNRALVVVVHGDVSKGGPATYHYDLARDIAKQGKNVSVFALVRPGYTGEKGQKSPGSNNGRSDHYTRQNNALVAQTIQNLAKSVGTSKVIRDWAFRRCRATWGYRRDVSGPPGQRDPRILPLQYSRMAGQAW